MLAKLQQSLSSATPRDTDRIAALLDQLNDPVADRTDWTPLANRGLHRHTHRLVQDSVSRWVIRPTLSARIPSGLVGLLLVAMGTLLSIVGVVGLWNPIALFSQSLGAGLILLAFLLGGLFLATVGIWQYWWLCQPRIFDLQANCYWRGKLLFKAGVSAANKKAVPLDQLHAVQIAAEWVSGTKGSNYRDFKSYEINLVLHDATRVNVVDHGNLKHIRKDAQTIANLIGVPVWDATA